MVSKIEMPCTCVWSASSSCCIASLLLQNAILRYQINCKVAPITGLAVLHIYTGDLGLSVAADSVDSAQKEIALWFKPDELAQYEATIAGWIYEAKSKL